MNSKAIIAVANLFSVIVLIWLHVAKNGIERPAKERDDGGVEFTRDPITYLILPLTAFFPAWAVFNDLGKGNSSNLWGKLMLALVLFGAAAELFRLPGKVIVAHDAIEQHFWLRSEKRIRWGEITNIKMGADGKALILAGSDGTKIVFSDQLADRSRFLEEIRKHGYGNQLPDALTETVLGLQVGRK